MKEIVTRPLITDFKLPEDFVSDMIRYRKSNEVSFSVSKETKTLRKISSTLVSLILSKKRKLTLDRVDDFCKLLKLNTSEKFYLKNWLESIEVKDKSDESDSYSLKKESEFRQTKRKETSVHILNDWLNLYVKDCFELNEVQKKPELIYKKLANVAQPPRIKKSLDFLLKHGYLRRKPNGTIVLDTPLTVTDPKVASSKIRSFHKNALKLAKVNMDIYSTSERLANTATIALTKSKYQELVQLIEEFSEKLQQFSENSSSDILKNKNISNQNEVLQIYQLIINLSPVGGKHND